MFKVITEGCQPTRGSKYSACVDLYAAHDCVIGAGETKLVGLGVAIDIHDWYNEYPNRIPQPFGGKNGYQDSLSHWMKGHYLQLMLRSSLGKKGLILPNGVGVIDLDYADEVKAMIHRPMKLYHGMVDNSELAIKKGDKIAQITLLEHKSYLFGIETDNERRGGFGSTGE
jgi:dUTPase